MRQTGQKVVVKHVQMGSLDEDEVRLALNEVKALCSLNHPNIVRCLGGWVSECEDDASVRPWDPGCRVPRRPIAEALTAWASSQDCFGLAPSLNILTEYMDGGSLDRLITQNARAFEEELVGTWLAQLALAIDHMHGQSLLHRDIKPANIFISQSGLVKLGDLGSCKMLRHPNEDCSSEYGICALSPAAAHALRSGMNAHARTHRSTKVYSHNICCWLPMKPQEAPFTSVQRSGSRQGAATRATSGPLAV
jgi:serine/threonine protein kinase